MSARNPLIVRADICGFSARSSVEKVKFSVSCTVRLCLYSGIESVIHKAVSVLPGLASCVLETCR